MIAVYVTKGVDRAMHYIAPSNGTIADAAKKSKNDDDELGDCLIGGPGTNEIDVSLIFCKIVSENFTDCE